MSGSNDVIVQHEVVIQEAVMKSNIAGLLTIVACEVCLLTMITRSIGFLFLWTFARFALWLR